MQRCARTRTICTAHGIPLTPWHNPILLVSRPWLPYRRPYSSVSAADLTFGQPLHETHPHLLKPGELTPGITALEYAQRRKALAAQLPVGGIAILASADVRYKSRDVFYAFHQDSNFLYVTGFNEPDSLAIIARPSSSLEDHEFHLYVREKDPKAEQWEGTRSGTAAATDVFNADFTSNITTSTPRIREIITSASKIYTDIPTTPPPTLSLLSRLTTRAPSTLPPLLHPHNPKPLQPLLNTLRVIKSPAELSLLRHIGRQSGRALTSAMSQPWTSEAALAAYLDHQFITNGLNGPAYIPVVAGGPRASIIHYVSNNQLLRPEELVLADAGGELGGYVTDITRTFPSSPTFTPAQRDLYTAVLRTQQSLISLCRSSAAITLDALHSHAEDHLASSLSQLGFPTSKEAMRTLFPHHVGHYVGMDVHDTPEMSRGGRLREGMVISVEPGVYVPDDDKGGWPERFRGMSIRVEDTVAFSGARGEREEVGGVVLSVEGIREVEDIEALRS